MIMKKIVTIFSNFWDSLKVFLLMTLFEYYSYINFQVFYAFANWLQFLPIWPPADLLFQSSCNY